jgi:hypothetical protein
MANLMTPRSGPPPNAPQIAAMQHLRDNEATIASAVLQAVFDRYPEEKEAYEDAMDDALPEITEPSRLRSLMGLSNVYAGLVRGHHEMALMTRSGPRPADVAS